MSMQIPDWWREDHGAWAEEHALEIGVSAEAALYGRFALATSSADAVHTIRQADAAELRAIDACARWLGAEKRKGVMLAIERRSRALVRGARKDTKTTKGTKRTKGGRA